MLPAKLIVGWGIGSLGTSTLQNGISILALFYLTRIAGLPPATAGTLILVAKLYDVVTDPLMGWLSDRTRGSQGRRRPYLLVGALLSAASFVALFQASAAGPALAALLLYATGYTVFGIPYLAMPAEMTGDYHERSRLMSARTICLSLGILAGGSLGPALVGAFGGGASGFAAMSWVLAAIIGAAMLGAWAGTAGARETTAQPVAGDFGRRWRAALANRPFAVLIASKFCHLTGVAVSMSSLLFLIGDVLERDEQSVGWFVLASVAGTIASMPAWLGTARRFGKRDTYLIAAGVYVPVLLSWLIAHPAEPLAVLLVRGFVTGVATGGLTLAAQAMLPDTIDEDFRLSGERREATFTAIYTVAEKTASAGGPFIVGLVLQATGVNQDGAGESAPAVLWSAVGIPLIATTASAVVLLWYALDRQLRDGETTRA